MTLRLALLDTDWMECVFAGQQHNLAKGPGQ
ncbi:protein of unknown function [Blastococcus saxobsidens DD2]|uniref:Uncharacterized protein n=1 Tax=Blastococcus saxobsidens (strain DD2) TaxID=1146883 RepID=H6RV01_BLASD|nr:protein of unknown function [Blastococcus saxobsidens DD2]